MSPTIEDVLVALDELVEARDDARVHAATLWTCLPGSGNYDARGRIIVGSGYRQRWDWYAKQWGEIEARRVLGERPPASTPIPAECKRR